MSYLGPKWQLSGQWTEVSMTIPSPLTIVIHQSVCFNTFHYKYNVPFSIFVFFSVISCSIFFLLFSVCNKLVGDQTLYSNYSWKLPNFLLWIAVYYLKMITILLHFSIYLDFQIVTINVYFQEGHLRNTPVMFLFKRFNEILKTFFLDSIP